MEKKSTPWRGSSSKSSSRQLSESFKSRVVSSDESSSGENKSKQERRRSEDSEEQQQLASTAQLRGLGARIWWVESKALSPGACPSQPESPHRVLVSVFSYEMQSLDSAPSEQAFLRACTSLGPQGRCLALRLQKMAVYNPGRHGWGPGRGRVPPHPAFAAFGVRLLLAP